ncbi:7921_t:CDS:2, partial [Dentiscutata heterogama]
MNSLKPPDNGWEYFYLFVKDPLKDLKDSSPSSSNKQENKIYFYDDEGNKIIFFNVLWDTMFKYKQIDYDKYYKTIEDYAEKVRQKIYEKKKKNLSKLNFQEFFKLFQEEIKNKDILDFCK